ncbi:hypothetical protein P7D52_01405 [Enterococcus dongliensis]|uniref:Transposase n=1 Tax=Enterococcus dongliensis TaxID=2559925 RepID=A0AAW8TJE0_9ENTE|nr:hypothetical protein [Enterococcus dongliensis]MDT2635067.1 hypothetical protein [Enterococcus dongliensis]MDT2636250.1 hypothetical protein [Enterococcus dongliensis]MDT2641472.1 hypothetical protein [Enterococcus dongliensis]
MRENSYEVDANKVIEHLLKRLSQVELENATLNAALGQLSDSKDSKVGEGE